MLIMENYVVRIYRRSSDNPENIAGVVEKPDRDESKTFNSKKEFDNIFWPSLLSNSPPIIKKTLEFRKYRRFQMKKGTLVLDSTSDNVTIIDISMGGLSFTCPDISIDPKEPFYVKILFRNNQYNTEKIKCRLVKRFFNSNSLGLNEQNSINRYSVKFEDLTPYQSSQIRHIVQNYTLGDA
jgi:hypothetical protein